MNPRDALNTHLAETLQQFIKAQNKTREACMTAVSTIPGTLQYVPKHLVSERMCIAAVGRDTDALSWVPASLRTPNVCAAAIAHDPLAILHVPTELITEQMCLEVVARNGNALSGVPMSLRTPSVCRVAVAAPNSFCAVEFLPSWVYASINAGEGHDIVKAALMANSDAITRISRDVGLPDDLLLASVATFGHTLVHVPQDRRTPQMYVAAIEVSPQMLENVPNELLTRELCERAIRASVCKSRGIALHEASDPVENVFDVLREVGAFRYEAVDPCLDFVPRDLRDASLCMSAIEATPDNAEFVPAWIWSETMVEVLARRARDDGYAKWVPAIHRDRFFDAVDAMIEQPKAQQGMRL